MSSRSGFLKIAAVSVLTLGTILVTSHVFTRSSDAARPDAVQSIPQWLKDAFANNGFNNVQYVVVVQPGDRFTAFVPDPNTGKEYEFPGNTKIKIPRGNEVREEDFEELVVIQKNSPAWVTVCKKIGGEKVCWEERR